MTAKPLHSDNRTALTLDEMIDMGNNIIGFVEYILKELRTIVRLKKDILFMFSLSRAVVQLSSISVLYGKNHFSDCMILYRTQVERLLTLYYLIDTETIQDFDDWSFIQNFEARNKARSDKDQNEHLNPKFWKESSDRVDRYQRLKKRDVKWSRPNSEKLEEIAKSHDVHEFFKYGYRDASGFVHPLASDGEEEYALVTEIKPRNHLELDRRPIFSNSLVVFILIVELALNEMNFSWNKYVFSFIDRCKDSIRNGNPDYLESKKIIDGFIINNLPIFKKLSE